MEPVTHFLTGACIGRAGFNRKTAYATLAAALAAEAADMDVFWGFAGPVDELKHHRGITHTFWAIPVIAAVIVGMVWLIDLIRRNRHSRAPSPPTEFVPSSSSGPADERGGIGRAQRITIYEADLAPARKKRAAPRAPGQQPIRWGWLYLTTFIAASTHILLDWTNNYGVRPFFPFNPRWYAGSFMFIAEPVIWGLFFLAFFMPWVLGLADREMGVRRQRFRGRGWAIFALAAITALGCWRWSEHARARTLVDNVEITSEPVTRMAFEPYPINPFHWHGILETPHFYQTAEIDTRTGAIASDPATDVMYKPADTPAVEAAKRTPLGEVYLDWGSWAVVRDIGQQQAPGVSPPSLPPGRAWTTVEFTDLRFDYAFTSGRGPARSVLGGWVYIVDGHDDAGEIMSGREQH